MKSDVVEAYSFLEYLLYPKREEMTRERLDHTDSCGKTIY